MRVTFFFSHMGSASTACCARTFPRSSIAREASAGASLGPERAGKSASKTRGGEKKTLAACKDTSKRAGKKISLRLQLTCGKAARFGERIPTELTRGKAVRRFGERKLRAARNCTRAVETLHASKVARHSHKRVRCFHSSPALAFIYTEAAASHASLAPAP